MYIDTVPNRNSPPAVLLRESFRQHGKVKKRTIANLSKCPAHVVDGLRILLKGGIALRSPNELLSILRSYPHGHVAAVLGSLHQLGLHSLISRPASRQRDLVGAMIVARVVDARSKLATARGLDPESAVSSLGHLLQLGSVHENELYAAMDWLLARQHAIEQRLAKRHLNDNTLMLYDLTSSYFEGHSCPLARRGHSRDGKRGTLQIVFGLLCTAAGCPIAVEVFEGSTGDPKTVAAQVDKIRNRFGLQRVVLVGDRGMLTGARIREDLQGIDGLRWITTLRAPTIRKLIKTRQVAQTMFDERDLAEISSPDFPRRAADRVPQPDTGRATAAQKAGVVGLHGEGSDADRDRHAARQRAATRRRRHRRAGGQGDQPLQDEQAFPDHHHRRLILVRA